MLKNNEESNGIMRIELISPNDNGMKETTLKIGWGGVLKNN